MIINYSKHTRERMVLRGISVREVEDAIARGTKELQKPDKIVSHYTYFSVVYRKIGEAYYIITVKPR